MVSCVGIATAWMLFCKFVQACCSAFAMLSLVPGISALSSFSQVSCDVEMNLLPKG
jgi:hypothetical protein